MSAGEELSRPIPPTAPRISVIVCTWNRPEMLQCALASVRDQDIDEMYEVLVIDDGSQIPVTETENAGMAVRIIRTPHRGVGAARFEGLAAARGELIAWCDDDDAWTRDHLRVLRDFVREHPAVDLVYGDSQWAEPGAASTSVAYSVTHDGSLLKDSPYIFASDVMHRAAAAREAGGFDASLKAFEDWDLWLRMSMRGMLRHIPITLGTHHWHQECVSSTDNWEARERVRAQHQARLERAGPAALHDLVVAELRPASYDPTTWEKPRREILCHAILRANQGYGSAARQLLLALEEIGVAVTIAPTRNQPVPGFERFYRPIDDWRRIAFYYDYLDRPSVFPAERIIHYTMAESTRVPQAEVEEINRAVSLLYVPCRQNVDVFQECGVRVPMRVLHHGVDPKAFPLLERARERDVFTFGTFGELSPRKGVDVLVRAFQDEFRPHEAVRLLMKTTASPQKWGALDPRIRVVGGFVDHNGLLDLLRQMDAFVMPSRGEGFGLCGLEAMATGLPLIATNWSGPADYLDPADSFPLNYRLVDAGGIEAHGMNFFGQWAEPDYHHLRHLLRWAYEHRDQAASCGAHAAERVHRDWTWRRAAEQMCSDLDDFARQWADAPGLKK